MKHNFYRYLRPVLVAAILLAVLVGNALAATYTIHVQAKAGWVDTGLDVQARVGIPVRIYGAVLTGHWGRYSLSDANG